MMLTPALSSCERWKQKVISSRARGGRALHAFEREEIEPEALQPQLEVDRVDGVEVAGRDAAVGVDRAVGEERHGCGAARERGR